MVKTTAIKTKQKIHTQTFYIQKTNSERLTYYKPSARGRFYVIYRVVKTHVMCDSVTSFV